MTFYVHSTAILLLAIVLRMGGIGGGGVTGLRVPQAGVENMVLNIILSAAAVAVALAIGLLLRRFLVRRLKKTVLDDWAVQTLGILIIIPPLLLGATVALAIWSYLNQFLQGLQDRYHIDIYALGLNLFGSIVLILLGIGVARTVNKLTLRGLGENRVDINIRILIGRVFYIVTMAIVAFWILSIWHLPLDTPVAAVGIITVAISFAIQDILKDLVAGFYLLVERPFFIGDQISVTIAPTVIYVGRVEDVRLRATKLRLVGGEEITIPNSILFGGPVTNNTFYGERRGTILVTLPEADFSRDTTLKSILQCLKDLDVVMDKPEPTAIFNGYAEGKVKLVVRFWLASGQVMDISDVMFALHVLLPNADLEAREPAGMA